MLTSSADSQALTGTSGLVPADRSALNTQLNGLMGGLPEFISRNPATDSTQSLQIQERFMAFTEGLGFNFDEQAPSIATLQRYLKDELGEGLLSQSSALSSAVGLRWVSLSAEQDDEFQHALETGLLSLREVPHTPDASAN